MNNNQPASPLPHSPPSACNSVTSETHPTAVKSEVDGATANNAAPNLLDVKVELTENFVDIDSPEVIKKYKKYEVDYTRYLMNKYFSKKNIYGGCIFDEKTVIGEDIIHSSRWHCCRSFADPLQAFKDLSSSESSTSATETPTRISGETQPMKTA